MPKTFGNPGAFATSEARRRFNRILIGIAIVMPLTGYVCGLVHGLVLGKHPHVLAATLILCFLFPVGMFAGKKLSKAADKLQAEAKAFRKGADGEELTADALSSLPETYSVFHDLTHPSIRGNIDHLVVGPTGVFVLETKNWTGMVTLSGQGTLMIDSQHDHSSEGKAVLGRAVEMKKKIEALSNIDTFVQAVMVFPKASVNITSDTHCALYVQRLDKLEDFLKKPSPRPLSSTQVSTITRDLQALFKV